MSDSRSDAARSLDILGKNPDLLIARSKKKLSERKLIDFMELYWHVLHPGKKMMRGWALEAVCDHLEGVSAGHISHLLINVPPGFSKSMATNVFWPMWEWGPRNMPGLQYLSAAYSDALTVRDNERAMALMLSPEYLSNWGDIVVPDKNTFGKVKFLNTQRGHKEATSVKGLATGGRGDRLICDDPHNILAAESDAIRMETVKWFTEVWPSRTNSAESVFVVIMQRVHEEDVSAACLELGFTHLCIPMGFEWDHPHRWVGGGYIAHEPARRAVEEIERAALLEGEPVSRAEAYERFLDSETCDEICMQPGYISDTDSWQTSFAPQYGPGDPRKDDEELAFPELFTKKRVREMQRKMELNDPLYAWAGQMQQRPVPRGGGTIKDEHIIYCEPRDVPEGGTPFVSGWDLAGSNAKRSPFTVKVRGKYGPDGVLYIIDRAKERVDSDKLDEFILREMEKDGKGTLHSLPQDPGQAGKYQKKAMSRRFRGWWFTFSLETGDKVSRANPIISQFGAKNVRIVRGHWNKDFVTNIKKFPAGKYKDDMDALSRMDMELTQTRGRRKFQLTTQRLWNYANSTENDGYDGVDI